MADAHCEINGRGTSTAGDRLTGFSFQYTRAWTAGTLDVEAFIEENRFHVILLMHEAEHR